VYSVISAMVFLVMSRHSTGACVAENLELDPERYIASQADIILHGLAVQPGDTASPQKKNGT